MRYVIGRFWLLGLLLVLGLASTPAAAQKFTVILQNGTQFETLYRPKEAAWDTNMVLVLGDAGNWVALPKDDIVKVTSRLQELGFGTYIDEQTVQIGYSVNDAPTDEELKANQPKTPLEALNRFLEEQGQLQAPAPQVFNVNQFVNPDQAGGGLPAAFGSVAGTPAGVGFDDVEP